MSRTSSRQVLSIKLAKISLSIVNYDFNTHIAMSTHHAKYVVQMDTQRHSLDIAILGHY